MIDLLVFFYMFVSQSFAPFSSFWSAITLCTIMQIHDYTESEHRKEQLAS